MEITFFGDTSQNLFGEILHFSIATSTDGIQIIDDYSGKTGHMRTRIRIEMYKVARRLFGACL